MASLGSMNKILSGLSLVFLSTLLMAEEFPLRIGVVQEYGQFNPITMNLASTEAFMHFVMRELTTRDEKGHIIADLAEKVPSLENKLAKIISTRSAAKKLVATWNIKNNAKWSDGKTITCQDLWLGWQVGLSPNTGTTEKTMYTKIEKIEWSEAKSQLCTITYTNTSWTFDRDLPYPIPYHLENSVFTKYRQQKEAYDQNSLYVTSPSTLGLYSGPYMLSEFKLGSHFILVKNPHFFGTPAKIEKIMVKHIGDSSTLAAHLKTGAINMVSAVGFPPDLALSFADAEAKENYHVFFQDSPIFQGLFFNHENEFLKEVNLRKAIAYSIDKKKLTDAFFKSKFKPAETFLPPSFSEFKQKPATLNIDKAKKLLSEAGWITTDNKVRTKNGKSLVIDFKTSAGLKILETIQVYICNEFSKIQVGCSIKNQPPRILLGDTITKGEFGMALYGNSILPDTSLASLFSSKEIPRAENSWTGGNNLRWKSAKMDQLVLQFDQENNQQKRNKYLVAMETEILDQAAFVPIYHRKEASVMPKELTGLTYLSKGTNFIFPERWSLK